MGLDIHAYKNLLLMDKNDVAVDEDGYPEDYDNYMFMYLNEHFPLQGEGLVNGGIYFINGDEFSFRAGSYSGYSEWRNELAKLAQYSSIQDVFDGQTGPFSELINYSDCEGAIGPVASAKLLKDFQDFDERAQAVEEADIDKGWFYCVYSDFKTAFEMASHNGAVVFG